MALTRAKLQGQIDDGELSALPVGSVVITVINSPPDTAGTWAALGSQTLFGATVYGWKRTG
jgi:hypothetical protein